MRGNVPYKKSRMAKSHKQSQTMMGPFLLQCFMLSGSDLSSFYFSNILLMMGPFTMVEISLPILFWLLLFTGVQLVQLGLECHTV